MGAKRDLTKENQGTVALSNTSPGIINCASSLLQ